MLSQFTWVLNLFSRHQVLNIARWTLVGLLTLVSQPSISISNASFTVTFERVLSDDKALIETLLKTQTGKTILDKLGPWVIGQPIKDAETLRLALKKIDNDPKLALIKEHFSTAQERLNDHWKAIYHKDRMPLDSLSILDQVALENALRGGTFSEFNWSKNGELSKLKQIVETAPFLQVEAIRDFGMTLLTKDWAGAINYAAKILDNAGNLTKKIQINFHGKQVQALAILPAKSGSISNSLINLAHKIGLSEMIFCPECLSQTESLGMYDSNDKRIYISSQAIFERKLTGTEAHEVSHAIMHFHANSVVPSLLYGHIQRTQPSSQYKSWGYEGFMSLDEALSSLKDIESAQFLIKKRLSSLAPVKSIKISDLVNSNSEERILLHSELSGLKSALQTALFNASNISYVTSEIIQKTIKEHVPATQIGNGTYSVTKVDKNGTLLFLGIQDGISTDEQILRLNQFSKEMTQFVQTSLQYVDTNVSIQGLENILTGMERQLKIIRGKFLAPSSKVINQRQKSVFLETNRPGKINKIGHKVTINGVPYQVQSVKPISKSIFKVTVFAPGKPNLEGVFSYNPTPETKENMALFKKLLLKPASINKLEQLESNGMWYTVSSTDQPLSQALDTLKNSFSKKIDSYSFSNPSQMEVVSSLLRFKDSDALYNQFSEFPENFLVFEKGVLKTDPKVVFYPPSIEQRTVSDSLNAFFQHNHQFVFEKAIKQAKSIAELKKYLAVAGVDPKYLAEQLSNEIEAILGSRFINGAKLQTELKALHPYIKPITLQRLILEKSLILNQPYEELLEAIEALRENTPFNDLVEHEQFVKKLTIKLIQSERENAKVLTEWLRSVGPLGEHSILELNRVLAAHRYPKKTMPYLSFDSNCSNAAFATLSFLKD